MGSGRAGLRPRGNAGGVSRAEGSRICSPAGWRQCAVLHFLVCPEARSSGQCPPVLSPGAPTLTPLGPCAADAHPQDPLLHQRQLSLTWTAPALTRAGSLCFCQRGSPDSLPFPGCAALGPQGKLRAAGERRVHTRGRGADPCTTSCRVWRPPVPQAPPPADCGHTAARGGEAKAWPRRDHAKAGGVGVRQGGTALNALDSPAPALSPPSSTDSWGLCFLHPPGGLRSAPTATRDSPSATTAAGLVHPRKPGQRHHPFPGMWGGHPSLGEAQAGQG